MYRVRGLGKTKTKGESSNTSNVFGGAAAGMTIGYQTAMQTGSKLSGAIAGGIAMAAPFTGPAAPFVTAAASLVAPLTRLINGCGDTCIQATNIVNEAEPRLRALRDEYLNAPVRTVQMQTAVLEYMDEVFTWIQDACGQVGGAAGQRCISERLVKGGSAPWCPTRTGCDWITTLRDPVALDRPVSDDGNGLSLTEQLNRMWAGASMLNGAIPAGMLAAAALLLVVGGGGKR
jgi:hypothetical protein